MKKIFIALFVCTCFTFILLQTVSAQTEIIDAANKAFNDHNVQDYVALFSDDAQYFSNVDYKETVKGKDALTQLVTGWFTIIPDISARISHSYISGNTVIEEFEFSGTIKALLPGYPESLKDKSFNVKACSVSTLENGKVKTMNMYWDYLSMLNQLGWTNIVPGH